MTNLTETVTVYIFSITVAATLYGVLYAAITANLALVGG